jgi:hypothetical protein
MDEFSSEVLADPAPVAYVPPEFTVISLDCEITSYAPVDGDPLF